MAITALTLAACTSDGTSSRQAYVAKSCGPETASHAYEACAQRAKTAFLGPPAGVIFTGDSGGQPGEASRTAR